MAPQARFGWDEATRTLSVSGDLSGAADVEQLITGLGSSGQDGARRLDVTEVTFLPSSVVSVVVRACLGARPGGPLEVVAAPDTMAHRILSLVAVPLQDR